MGVRPILGRGVLYIKDGPLDGNPRPCGELYRPTLKAVAMGTISFSGIEPIGKIWAAQAWYCETYNTSTPVGASKKPDGTLDGLGLNTAQTITPSMDLFDTRPTVLKHPAWYSDTVAEETILPLRVGDYKVTPAIGRDGRWTVTSSQGETVYCGIGPVTVSAG